MNRRISRRRFVIAHTLGGIGLTVAALIRARPARSAPAKDGNPFAYDTTRFERTDPKLIQFEEAQRFKCPRGEVRRLMMTPDGRLALAAGNYATFLSPEGGVVLEIALPGTARCLAVAEDGLIYAGLRDRIEVYSAEGEKKATWEALAKRPWLTGLAVSGNHVFAADAGNRLLWRFDRSGKLLGRIGERNPDRNIPGFIIPSPYFDVDVAPDGLLRVNNPGRHRVEVYTQDGDFELAWGQPSAGIDGFCGCCNPISLALLADGSYVTCEKGLPRVKVYNPHGEFESVVAGVESFPENARVGSGDGMADTVKAGLDVAVGRDGRVYVLDLVTAELRVWHRKNAAHG